jgi:hypothetical protein
LLAVSEALRKVMIGYGFPADRILTHYTGIDRSIYRIRDRAAEKAKLGVTGRCWRPSAPSSPAKARPTRSARQPSSRAPLCCWQARGPTVPASKS